MPQNWLWIAKRFLKPYINPYIKQESNVGPEWTVPTPPQPLLFNILCTVLCKERSVGLRAVTPSVSLTHIPTMCWWRGCGSDTAVRNEAWVKEKHAVLREGNPLPYKFPHLSPLKKTGWDLAYFLNCDLGEATAPR